MDPFIAQAESLRRSAAEHGPATATTDSVGAIQGGLPRLTSLLTTPGDASERVRAASLLIASLPPATRGLVGAEVCDLAEGLPLEAVEEALASVSPHVRAGARIIHELRRSPSAPDERRAPRPAPRALRAPAGESPSSSAHARPVPGPDAVAADVDVRAVLAGLARPEATTRLDAIARLAGRPLHQSVIEVLLGMIADDPSGDVRVGAVRAFVSAPTDVRVAAAERALVSDDEAVHLAALGLLREDDPMEIVVASRFLRSPSIDVASRAADVLSRVLPAEAAVGVLWQSLPHLSDRLQEEILGRLQEIAPATLDLLARVAAAGSDVEARSVALLALRGSQPERLGTLVTALADPAPAVRRAALRSLARRWDPNAFDAVAVCCTDPRPDVRAWAVALLHAARDDRALPHLVVAAADPVDEVRRAARDAVRSMASGDAVDRIIRMLDDETTASTAEAVLADISAAIAPRLVRRLDDLGEDGVRRAGALLRSSGSGAPIRAALRDSDPAERRRAAQALALMRGREAVPELIELFDDPDPDVRIAAVDLIAAAGEAGAAEQLALFELRELDPRVRTTIRRARNVLGSTDDARAEVAQEGSR